MKELDKLNGPAILHINSVGGDFYAGLALYSRITCSPHAVHTIGYGLVASIAVILLAAGTTSSLTEDTWIYLHEGSTDYGHISPTQAHKALIQSIKLEHQYCNILAKHTSIPAESWEELCLNETYLNPKQALQYGLVDQILRGPKCVN